MKKMNSILTALTTTMAVSLMTATLGAFAAETEQNFNYNAENQNSQNVKVSYANDPTYMVTIPADVTFEALSSSQEKSLSASDILLPHGKVVQVSVASVNGYHMVNEDTTDAESYVGYSVKAATSNTSVTIADAFKSDGDGVSSGTDSKLIATFANGTANTKGTGSVTLTLANDNGENAVAASYADNLTFTIAVVDATA